MGRKAGEIRRDRLFRAAMEAKTPQRQDMALALAEVAVTKMLGHFYGEPTQDPRSATLVSSQPANNPDCQEYWQGMQLTKVYPGHGWGDLEGSNYAYV